MKTSIMTIVILIGIVAVIAFSVMYYNKVSSTEEAQNPANIPAEAEQTVPDLPVGFGYKCMWIAVPTRDLNKFAGILKLKNTSECNWQVGIKRAYDGAVFITPPIDGWTLACGWGLPHGDTKESIEDVKAILNALSLEFGEAQFFCTHRVTEYHCWIKSTNGQTDRVYSYLGESGENIAIEGQPTEFENNLNLINTFSEEAKDASYFEREDIVWPDEQLLMQVAEHWSLNPTTIDDRNDLTPSLGLLGNR